MPALQPLASLLKVDIGYFSETQLSFLEAELFLRICEELKESKREKYKDYFQILKFNFKKENLMLDRKFISCIIHDILTTEEYNLAGIALYTQTPEEVIYELAIEKNTNPTLILARKIIELHRNVKPNLYQEITNKIRQKSPPSSLLN